MDSDDERDVEHERTAAGPLWDVDLWEDGNGKHRYIYNLKDKSMHPTFARPDPVEGYTTTPPATQVDTEQETMRVYDALRSDTCGLIEDGELGSANPVSDYIYGIEKYGRFDKMGSMELIEHLRTKVTTIEARLSAEHGMSKDNDIWQAELEFLDGERDGICYLDETDAMGGCIMDYQVGGSRHHPSYAGWAAVVNTDGTCNPAIMYNRAARCLAERDATARAPWQLLAIAADNLAGRNALELQRKQQEERCEGIYTVAFTNTTELQWRDITTRDAYTVEPSDEMLARKRARNLLAKTTAKRDREDSSDTESAKRPRTSDADEHSDEDEHPDEVYINALMHGGDIAAARMALSRSRSKRYSTGLRICIGQHPLAKGNDDWLERIKLELSALQSKQHKSSDKGPKGSGRSISSGGGAMPFIEGSKREILKDVQMKRPAPVDRQEPVQGYVPFRTDAIEHNSIGERECVIEAIRAATGERLTRKGLGLDPKGDLNFKEVAVALPKSTCFALIKSPPVKWRDLVEKPAGIYIGRAQVKPDRSQQGAVVEAHYVVYDAWRHLFFLGGAPPPPTSNPVDHLLYHDAPPPLIDTAGNVVAETTVGRAWFVEDAELADPDKFQAYMCTKLNVTGSIDGLYRVDMHAQRARETSYNTPDHYDHLVAAKKDKAAEKLRAKATRAAARTAARAAVLAWEAECAIATSTRSR